MPPKSNIEVECLARISFQAYFASLMILAALMLLGWGLGADRPPALFSAVVPVTIGAVVAIGGIACILNLLAIQFPAGESRLYLIAKSLLAILPGLGCIALYLRSIW